MQNKVLGGRLRRSKILETDDACPKSPVSRLRYLLGHICMLEKDMGTAIVYFVFRVVCFNQMLRVLNFSDFDTIFENIFQNECFMHSITHHSATPYL